MGKFYHGTSFAGRIITSGFDISSARRNDPGDFGWGIYFTQQWARAQAYGRVLQVEMDVSRFAVIPNPYFLKGFERVSPVSEVEQLFHNLVFDGDVMRTVNLRGEERVAAAHQVREVFLERGYKGILTRSDDGEAVAFDPHVIRDIQEARSG